MYMLFACVSTSILPCKSQPSDIETPGLIHDLNDAITKTITPDGINPPLASRYYLYPNIVFHEVYCLASGRQRTYEQALLRHLWLPEVADSISAEYTAFYAFVRVAESIVYRPELLKKLTENQRVETSKGLSKEIIEASEKYVESILDSTLKWIAEDGFDDIRALPDYSPIDEAWAWEPTPPNYMDALEPNWPNMKSIIGMDTTSLIQPPALKFDTLPGTDFYKAAEDVYNIVNTITSKQIEIAKHWDCNPLQTHANGHFMYASRQMTPGGHWMGIAGIAATKSKFDLFETSKVYTNVSMVLYEGFIVSWKTKFRYELIRPETYINRYINPNWRPILETPPFPEYTSAHSVISMGAAMILTAHFGDSFEFKDTMEVQYRLPVRDFSSFISAAKEVSESRVYGGIHYRFGVNDGMSQGAQIANQIIGSLRIKEH